MVHFEEKDKLVKLMEYWLTHNEEHLKENVEWQKKAGELGLDEIVHGLSHVIEYSKRINDEFKEMLNLLQKKESPKEKHDDHLEIRKHEHITLHPIGVIRTPFKEKVPHDKEWKNYECAIIINESLVEGLEKLVSFSHIYVVFYLHKRGKTYELKVKPNWADGVEVGVFASRSPVRPNPVGITITEIKRIYKNVIYTGGIDAIDGSPLLDIKPYIKSIDCIQEANDGWITEISKK